MKFYLIIARGKRKGQPIPIFVDLFMIGSGRQCQLQCRMRGAPPQHCAIVTRDRKVFIRDLNSGVPVLVNGELLPPGQEWPLHKGDRIELGDYMEFLLQMREKPLSQRDLEEWALGCLDQAATREFEDPDEIISKEKRQTYSAAEAAAGILDHLAAMRGEVVGRLRIGREGDVTVVRFNDRHLVEEAEIAYINKELHDHLSKPNLRVLLDCKNVKRMSTAAVKMFDDLCTWLKPWGSTMALCRVQPEVAGILNRLAMHNEIPIFPDKPSALAGKW